MKENAIKGLIAAVLCCICALTFTVGEFPAGSSEIQPVQNIVTGDSDLIDDFEGAIEVEGVAIPPQDVPLSPDADGKAKVTTKTTTKTKKSTGTLDKKATVSKITTKTTTTYSKKSEVKPEATVVTETTVVKTVKTKYTKGSKKTEITTTTKTTVKTTTTPKSVTTADINKVAKNADPRLLARFSKEGYKYVIDTTLDTIGLFSSANKQITMRYQSDIVYHELGHYLAYTTGRQDETTEWKNIYKKEASKFDGDNKDYVTSTNKEYFAESYRDYVVRKSTLKSKRPETYAYVEKVLAML